MSKPSALDGLNAHVKSDFASKKRVLSYQEWFGLLAADPRRQARGVAQYVLDMFHHYGRVTVEAPTGAVTRWRLFDCPWDNGQDRLIGQEEVQGEVYRMIRNFTRSGRVTQLALIHGPNGSAKSSLIACITRAMEHFSTLDEGALYGFNWIFPSKQGTSRKRLGFGSEPEAEPIHTYAYLEGDDVDARIPSDLRDHPIFLVPRESRRKVIEELLRATGGEDERRDEFLLSDYIAYGDLSPKSRQIFEALLSSYNGDYERVLQHVQVERFFVSRRYRRAAVTVEPQMHVDAQVHQITADRSLASLPRMLQNLNLFEPSGDLVDANRGVVEYNDLLKRPVETFKYILATCEKANVALPGSILYLDELFIASSNEKHLSAFKEFPDFQSFKGRMELIKAPYIRSYIVERQIYDEQITSRTVNKHIAPHATLAASLWAVLTRMRRPRADSYPSEVRELVARLSPLDKAELYATGQAPKHLTVDQSKELRAIIGDLYEELSASSSYEGSSGASPREVKTILLNAAQDERYPCVSAQAIIEQIAELVRDRSVYDFLKLEAQGEYNDQGRFIEAVRNRVLDLINDEVRDSMGLVSEKQYHELFARYVMNVSYASKGEKLLNPVTGRLEEPDRRFMEEMEATFKIGKSPGEFRSDLISSVGAWYLDHPGQPPDYERLFPKLFHLLREEYYTKQRAVVQKAKEELLRWIAGEGSSLAEKERQRSEQTLTTLRERYGYCNECAKEAILFLLRERYS